MSMIKCKMCGGTLEVKENESIATCEDCQTKQTLPKLDDDRKINLYERASHFRRNNEFDKAMIKLLKEEKILGVPAESKWVHQDDKIIIYTKGDTVFIFNFHPTKSFEGYFVPVSKQGVYKTVLSTDDSIFGGFSRVDNEVSYRTYVTPDNWIGFPCYIPCRSAIVLKRKK